MPEGTVYLGNSDTYLFLGLNAKTGKEKIRYKTNGYIYSSSALAGSTAYFGDFTVNLCAADINSGSLQGNLQHQGRSKRYTGIEGNIDFNLLVISIDLSLYS